MDDTNSKEHPPAPTLDFARRDSTGHIILTLTALTTVFVAARLYTCTVLLRRRLSLEEWCIVASLVLVWVSTALMMLSLAWGTGVHLVALTVEQEIRAKFWFLMGTPPNLLGVSMPKISVIHLLCKIFDPEQWHRILMWFLGILCLVQFAAMGVVVVFGCKPVAGAWDFTIPGAKCMDNVEFGYFCYYASGFSGTLDFYLAIYPATQLSRLSWDVKKKVSLSIVLGLGVFSGGAAAYKTFVMWQLANEEDYTYLTSELIIWTAVEAQCIIISACAPNLHPLYERAQAYAWSVLEKLLCLRLNNNRGDTGGAIAIYPLNVMPSAVVVGGGGSGSRSGHECFRRPQRKGFWTERINSIISTMSVTSSSSSVASSTRSTTTTSKKWTTHAVEESSTCAFRTRPLGDAAAATQPPDHV